MRQATERMKRVQAQRKWALNYLFIEGDPEKGWRFEDNLTMFCKAVSILAGADYKAIPET